MTYVESIWMNHLIYVMFSLSCKIEICCKKWLYLSTTKIFGIDFGIKQLCNANYFLQLNNPSIYVEKSVI